MANIASQIKRNRQSIKRRDRNKAVRTEVRSRIRQFDAAVAEGDRASADAAFTAAARKLDKAASKGVVHRNFAANHKSQMAAKLNAL